MVAESEGIGAELYGVRAAVICPGEAVIFTATDRSPELHLR